MSVTMDRSLEGAARLATARPRSSRHAGDYLGLLGVFALFIGAWYALAYSIKGNFSPATGKPLLVPAPHQLFWGVGAVKGKIFEGLLISVRTAGLGLLISIALGVTLATLMSQARWIERALFPYLIALQAVPIIALVPLLINFFGANLKSRLITTVIISLFPIVANTLFGLLSVDRNQHDLFTLHSANRWTRLTRLQFPAALPSIFIGLRTAAGLAVIGSIVGDFFFTRGTPGLGRLITTYFVDNAASRMFVCSILASLLGIAFFLVFGLLNNRAVGHWHEASRK